MLFESMDKTDMKNGSKIRSKVIKRFLAAFVVVCILSGVAWIRAYAAAERPDSIEAGETFYTGLPGETNLILRIRFYRYKEDADRAVGDYFWTEYQSPIATFSSAMEDVSAPNISGESYGVVWKKAGEKKRSEDREWYWDVAYYAELPITINYDQNYQDGPAAQTPILYSIPASFASPSSTASVTLIDAFNRDGYEMLGWSRSRTATTADYAPGASYTVGINDRDITFYSVWKRKPATVYINYSPNGGIGNSITDTKTVTLDTDTQGKVELRSSADFTYPNYKLTGWIIGTEECALGSDYTFNINASDTRKDLSFGAKWSPKIASGISMNVADKIYDNDDIAGKITTYPSRTGTVTLEYKSKGEEDDAFTTVAPNTPGDYVVRATLEENDDYASASDFADFKLLSSKANVSVTYKPGTGTGTAISDEKAVTCTDGKGKLTLLSKADFTRTGYKLTGWSVGGKTYDLGADYDITIDTKSLTFEAVWTEKQKGTVDIDMKKPLYVGAEIKYDIDKNSDGDVTVEYKKKDDKDEKYSDKKPTEPGKYTVRATLKETDDYTAAEDTADFEIAYLTAPENPYSYKEVKNNAGTVTDVNVIPAEGYSISSSVDGSYGGSVSYTAVKAAGGSVYLKREKDKAVTEPVKLTEYKVEDSPKITVPAKIYYGTTYTVTTTALTPATKTVSYKKAGAADSTYSTALPAEPGKYTVRLSAPASGFYDAINVTKDFSIDYLEAPTTKATISGEKGEGKWYISDVYIKAPSGYEICTAAGGYYSDSIKWNDKITKIYYRRTSDGAKTDAVEVDFDVNIDKKNPRAVFDSSLGIAEGQKQISLYTDSITFTLADDNLKTVTVNGKKYDVSEGKCVIVLDTGLMAETKTVVATDEAGNSYTFTIELIPAWMQTNVMPLDKEVLLSAATEYSLEPGRDCVIDGEGIIYKGGSKFYVKTTGSFKFITN